MFNFMQVVFFYHICRPSLESAKHNGCLFFLVFTFCSVYLLFVPSGKHGTTKKGGRDE